jgi:hypothetical protein
MPIASCTNPTLADNHPAIAPFDQENAEAHPPGAAVARSPKGASDAAQRGWAPISLVGQSEPAHARR